MDGRICTVLLISLALAHAKVFKFDQSEGLPELENGGKHWAILVAGSNQFINYRHQADICHAYQILSKHGIPDERIIVMMYDDIAYNDANPRKGVIINHVNGPNVYPGVPKDYTGTYLNAENFLAILAGEDMTGWGSGKSLKSTEHDHIFVNFADHGGPECLAFPGKFVEKFELIDSIKKLHSKKMYKQLVFYIEACESGSMFTNVSLSEYNVFATTAADAYESSYACYYDDTLKTYLGDVYSVKWMEDSDKENLKVETLQKQYQIVKRETNTSHVTEFGDMSISKESVSNFQGKADADPIVYPQVPYDAVPSEDVPLHVAKFKVQDAETEDELRRATAELHVLLEDREAIRASMRRIVDAVLGDAGDATLRDTLLTSRGKSAANAQCYKATRDFYSERCFNVFKHSYALRHLHVLVNLCESGRGTNQILRAIESACA